METAFSPIGYLSTKATWDDLLMKIATLCVCLSIYMGFWAMTLTLADVPVTHRQELINEHKMTEEDEPDLPDNMP